MSLPQVNLPNRKEFRRRAYERLHELQPSLLPEHAEDLIAIEPDSGEYVLAQDRRDVYDRFDEKFPDKLAYVMRVDGGPVLRVPWVK